MFMKNKFTPKQSAEVSRMPASAYLRMTWHEYTQKGLFKMKMALIIKTPGCYHGVTMETGDSWVA